MFIKINRLFEKISFEMKNSQKTTLHTPKNVPAIFPDFLGFSMIQLEIFFEQYKH